MNLLISTASLIYFVFPVSANAEENIEESDLPTESVLPILDEKRPVLNRLVQKNKRWESFFDFGSITDEVYLNKLKIGATFHYHQSEDSSLFLKADQRFGGQTSYANVFESMTSARLQFSRAPQPTTEISFGYARYFHYGKLSVSKNIVYPMTSSWNGSLGALQFGKEYQLFSEWGLAQSLYFTKNWVMKIQLSVQAGYFYDITSVSLRLSQSVPSENSFSKKLTFLQNLGLSVGYLF